MDKVGSLLNWIGGGIGRMAGTGLATGIFLVMFGVTPAEYMAIFWTHPPAWASSGITRLAVLIIGLAVIAFSLTFNIWSRKQKAIDDLAEDLSWAIGDLVNRSPTPNTDEQRSQWIGDYHAWISKVSKKLGNKAFFTRADQIHFDRLGYFDRIIMGQQELDWYHSQLNIKFERLRDIINWSQMRRH